MPGGSLAGAWKALMKVFCLVQSQSILNCPYTRPGILSYTN